MIECLVYRAIDKGNLLGFADVKVVKWGLIIHSLTLHRKDTRFWVNMPQRKYEDKGETKYANYLRMENPEHQKELMKQILEAVLKERNRTAGDDQMPSESDNLDLFTF